jgi:hypothetical protein
MTVVEPDCRAKAVGKPVRLARQPVTLHVFHAASGRSVLAA